VWSYVPPAHNENMQHMMNYLSPMGLSEILNIIQHELQHISQPIITYFILAAVSMN
jgi:hypothetical protein